MADEFLLFLAAGMFLLFIGLALVLNIGPPAAEGNATFTVFETPVQAAYFSERKEADIGGMRLFSGLLFGSNSMRHHEEAEGLKDISISFTVKNSNGLGPLEIWVNGKKARAGNYAPGEYRVEIDQSFLGNKTDIEIRPSSSLWRIWAPNIYELKDVTVEAKSLSFGKQEFLFVAGADIDSFDAARIELVLDRNVGSLDLQLNDRTVFSGYVRNQDSIRIGKEDLKSGRNMLEIIPSQNSRFSGIARIVMFSV